MPFDKAFDDVYKLGIKPACEGAGAYCQRVDEQIYDGIVVERIYNQVAKADIIVSDMTGRNPNVFYETGYAHALGKRAILLTKDVADIPFDLAHYHHIIYGGSISDLRTELQARVEYFVANSEQGKPAPLPPVKHFIEHIGLCDNLTVGVAPVVFPKGVNLELNHTIVNSTDRVLDLRRTRFGIVAPREFESPLTIGEEARGYQVEATQMCKHILSLYPTQASHARVGFFVACDVRGESTASDTDRLQDKVRRKVMRSPGMQCFVRVFTESGTENIPFLVKFKKPRERK